MRKFKVGDHIVETRYNRKGVVVSTEMHHNPIHIDSVVIVNEFNEMFVSMEGNVELDANWYCNERELKLSKLI